MAYATKLDKRNPDDIMFAKLLTHYGEQRLTKLILASRRDYSVSLIARKLEKAQLRAWLTDKKNSDDVFKLLSHHNEDGLNLLKNPGLSVWRSHLEKLKKNTEDVLPEEMKMPRSMEEQYKKWISEGKTVDDVFKLLKLDKEGDSVFNSPMWGKWNSYITRLNKENPEKSMYLVLKSQFDEKKLKAMIGKAKENVHTKNIADKLEEEIWRSEGMSADDIFKLLKLDKKKEKFVVSPMLSTWVSYVTKLEKSNGKSDEFAAISYLVKKFGDLNLARMFGTAKKKNNYATKSVITDLQQLQFKQWMSEKGMDPKRLEAVFVRDTSAKVAPANVLVTIDFYDFYKTNGGSPFYRFT